MRSKTLLRKREEICDSIRKMTEKMNSDDRIETRQWLFYSLIDMFGMWQKPGDCLPDIVISGNVGFRIKRIEQ